MAENSKKTTGVESKKVQKTSRRLESFIATSELAKAARSRAQIAFYRLIEEGITPRVFREELHFINPEIYEDIIADRSTAGLCGYPLCSNFFKDKFGNRTYIIVKNTVYDITVRKNFCSDVCYEASEIILRQIPTSPLYIRETSVEKKIQFPARAKLSGLHGKIIDITGLGTGYNKVPQKSHKTSVLVDNIARESLIQCTENSGVEETKSQGKGSNTSKGEPSAVETNLREPRSEAEDDKSKLSESINNETQAKSDVGVKSSDNTDMENLIQKIENIELEKSTSQENKWKDTDSRNELENKNELLGCINSEGEQVKSCEDIKSTEDSIKGTVTGNPSHSLYEPLMPVYQIEKAMKEWMSFESLRVILGDTYVRGMLEHFGHSWQDYDTTSGLKLGIDARAKYIALCRKLDQQELQEEKEMIHLDVENDFSKAPTKAMPDYEQLKKDARKQELKVVSFLGGREQYEEAEVEEEEEGRKKGLEPIPEEQCDANKPAKVANPSGIVAKKGKGKKTKKNVDEFEVETSTLPLIDSYSQMAWRQQIVLEKTRKCLNEIVAVTALNSGKVGQLLKAIVITLDLDAHNISFRPGQWNLIMLIFMELLSIRYPVISAAMKTEKYCEFQENIISAFGLDVGYMSRIVTYLTEIQPVISKNYINNIENKEVKDITRTMSNQDATTNNQKDLSNTVSADERPCTSEKQISNVYELTENIKKVNTQEKSDETEQSLRQEMDTCMKSTSIEELD
ncbi:putative RNA polymerase II subunit B1 CTD phosphatase RPAP2 isoform X1 [Penaeus chinensis]|uniref:putative RNA polymerase II subunit B1 CTD phosphatase RPAP2 isoform X1 n=1 Tax=Penaeus chinensis TaxID=139456 RepID=UPI001FB65112|nr:putative RNA polymerase II subunit B1 CTD phosphatase RPAP2 isoform X1 [Penaeus chinensis]XP_047484403.1 putative RNA polymerase II subunit B1 CTD phosphatase RPAP2 isoform X1 [Penaeus chinensis]XP_047484404.1 putative RNA polymerase II subunit B1 CTD phosphatase RPAP2 isoform X1 [Penaeus chinensis]